MIDLDDQQLLRYSRQIMLPKIEYEGQVRLLGSHALIVGLGGLGSPVALYLAAAGVGELTLVNFDTVDLSNLQRQIAHQTRDIGQNKALSAQQACLSINPSIKINTITRRLESEELELMMQKVDVVIDASDNFATRYALNNACIAQKKPLVSGAAIRMEGQLSVFQGYLETKPCYQCLYPQIAQENNEETCSETGVLAPIVGAIGSLQATEAIKVLLDIGENLSGFLLIFDGLAMDWRKLKLSKNPDCPACCAQH